MDVAMYTSSGVKRVQSNLLLLVCDFLLKLFKRKIEPHVNSNQRTILFYKYNNNR